MTILVPGIEESREFFSSVQLAPLVAKPNTIRSLADLNNNSVTKSDFLLGENVPTAIGFTDNLDEDKKQAAADSIHFAERFASSYSDKQNKPIEWHRYYAKALSNCGWTLTSYKYNEEQIKKTQITMDSIVLDLVAATAGRNAPALISLLKGGFDKIQSDEQLVTLFDKNSTNGKDKDLRIIPCLQTPGGTAIATFVAVDCEISESKGGAWFWKWKLSNLTINRVATVMELNMSKHESQRDNISRVLDKDSDDFFKGIQLK